MSCLSIAMPLLLMIRRDDTFCFFCDRNLPLCSCLRFMFNLYNTIPYALHGHTAAETTFSVVYEPL